MKLKKGIFALLIALAVVCIAGSSQAMAAGESIWEEENNNNDSTFNVIELDTSYVGIINARDDRDWFRYTVSKKGYAELFFSVMDEVATRKEQHPTDFYGYKITIYDTYLNEIVCFHEVYNTFQSYRLPFAPGPYYICVESEIQTIDYAAPITYQYHFAMNFTESNDCEIEYNNKKEEANTLAVNKTMTAALQGFRDVDYFTFTLPENGVSSLDFVIDEKLPKLFEEQVNSLYGYSVEIYNEAGDLIMSRQDMKESFNSGNRNWGKGKYYVLVKPYINTIGYAVPSWFDYKIKVNYKKDTSFEGELNNDFKHANPYKIGDEMKGDLVSYDDYDWFKFTIKKQTPIWISLAVDEEAAGKEGCEGYVIDIVDAKTEQTVVKYDYIKRTVAKDFTLPAGTYYIGVRGTLRLDDKTAPVGASYSLNTGIAKGTAVKTVKNTAKGKITITWKKVKGAVGYTVTRMSADSNGNVVKEIKSGKTTKCVDTKAKKGKTYLYTVTTYFKVNGKKVQGFSSNPVAIECKK